MNTMKTKMIRGLRRAMIAPLRRFGKNRNGSAAIEFGLVLLPFVALLFAIIETAIIFLASQALETAVANSARLILTGQAQNGGFDQTTFKTAVCNNIHGLFDCANGVYVDVRSFTNFAAINLASPTTPTAISSTTSSISQAARVKSSSCACSISFRSTCSSGTRAWSTWPETSA